MRKGSNSVVGRARRNAGPPDLRSCKVATPSPSKNANLQPRPQAQAARLRVRLVVLGAALGGVFAVAHSGWLPSVPLCLFKVAAGRPCPGCGMTRSIVCLAHGDLAGSLRMHPLGIVLTGFAVAALAGTAVGLARGGDPVKTFLERRGVALVVGLLAVFVGVWVLRAFLVPAWSPDPVTAAPLWAYLGGR